MQDPRGADNAKEKEIEEMNERQPMQRAADRLHPFCLVSNNFYAYTLL